MLSLPENAILQGGKYKIERVLGQGGFGITYLAEQVMLGRKVAIKEFFMKDLCNRDESTSHVTLGTEGSRNTVSRFREKFLKEARNIARLNHVNIVRVIDVFEENGTAYYVMEYAEGGSLLSKLKKEGYLSEILATRYILQVADALEYIHQRKMNHLDVKPANIMLGENDNAILIDFGLSKQYDAQTGSQTSTTPVGISEGFAPMEQYKKEGVKEFTPETDVYSLAATFFKLLTGNTPPSASDVNEDGVPVEQLKAKGISPNAIDAICKAMKGRKKERTHSIREFANQLAASGADTGEISVISVDDDTVQVEQHTKVAEKTQYSSAKPQPTPQPAKPQPVNPAPAAPKAKTPEKVQKEEVKKGKSHLAIILVAVLLVAGIATYFIASGKSKSTPDLTKIVEKETVVQVKDLDVKENGVVIGRWTGAAKSDIPHGEGTLVYLSGDKLERKEYKGRMVNGKRDGEGATLKLINGDYYECSFKNDQPVYGSYYSFETGERFTGEFKDNIPYNGKWFSKGGKQISVVENGNEK